MLFVGKIAHGLDNKFSPPAATSYTLASLDLKVAWTV